MRWTGGRRSENIDDQRSAGGGMGRGFPVGGGLPGGLGMGRGRMPMGRGGGLGLGGIAIVVVAALLFGVDPSAILTGDLGGGGGQAPYQQAEAPRDPGQDKLADFVSVVLADTEDTWQAVFKGGGGVYQEPKLVLFSRSVRSACGMAGSAVGPFYCPADQRIYIDLAFYDDLQRRFGAPGDFAQAYVIAHEVGHHVQKLLGISDKVHSAQGRVGKAEGNQLSVRLELQADFFAGVWAHHAQKVRQVLEPGDLEEALRAATAIGDDALQKQAQGYAVPDSFTHGSSAQRARWFKTGLQSGNVGDCDTFRARQL